MMPKPEHQQISRWASAALWLIAIFAHVVWFFRIYMTQRPLERWTIYKHDADGDLVYRIRVERWRRHL